MRGSVDSPPVPVVAQLVEHRSSERHLVVFVVVALERIGQADLARVDLVDQRYEPLS